MLRQVTGLVSGIAISTFSKPLTILFGLALVAIQVTSSPPFSFPPFTPFPSIPPSVPPYPSPFSLKTLDSQLRLNVFNQFLFVLILFFIFYLVGSIQRSKHHPHSKNTKIRQGNKSTIGITGTFSFQAIFRDCVFIGWLGQFLRAKQPPLPQISKERYVDDDASFFFFFFN